MGEATQGEEKKPDVPDELTITLRKAVTLGDVVYAELNLREPNMGQIEQFQKNVDKWGALQAMDFFIATVAGVPKPVIDQVGGRDGRTAREYLSNFL